MKNQPSPEYIALCDSFIYHLLSNAPAGVNIKAQRSGEKVNIYILNAPAPLYDFEGFGAAVHCVRIDGVTRIGNAEYEGILSHLREALESWYVDNGRQRIDHAIHVGHPRRSFVAMAKDTPKPKEKKERKASGSALRIPKAEANTRNARIAWAMWHAFTAEVLGECYAADGETMRDFARFTNDIHSGNIRFCGDDTKKVYNFEGLRIECAPSALPALLVKFCKSFGYGYPHAFKICPEPSMVEAIAAKVVEKVAESAAAPAVVEVERGGEVAPAPVVEVVEPSPVEVKSVAAPIVEAVPVVAPAPAVEVKAVKRRRVGLGCMVARMVVALLSLLIAVLRLMVAAVRLVERGRLGEVVANGIASKYKAVRSFVAGRYIALLFAIIRTRAAIRARVEAVRLAIVGRCLAVRSAVVSWWRGLRRAVVGRYMATCLAIRARVEAVRLAIVGHIVRLSQAVSVAAAWLLVSARRVEHLANHLENL